MSKEFINTLPFLIPPAIALLAVTLLNMHLKTFQAIYLLCGASLIFMQIFVNSDIPLWGIIAALAAGEALHFALLAALGQKLSHSNYSAFLSMVGLAPWWLGLKFGIYYIALSILFIMFYAHGKFLFAKAKAPVKVKSLKDAKKSLSDTDYNDFKSRAVIVFSAPIAIALVAAAAIAT